MMPRGAAVGIGVVGAGFMGRAFAQICAQLTETRLVGIADVSESAGRPAAERHGVPWYRDAGDLIARPDVEAVIVATPEDAHVEPCVLALDLGKAVLVEKPIADSAANGLKIAAAARGGTPLLAGHVLRFHPHYVLAKQAADDGRIGAVRHVYARRLGSVHAQERLRGRCGLALFLGVHDYDIARWFAASEPARVYSESQFGVLRDQGYDVDDANWTLITFQNGVLAACETGWILPDGHASGSDMRLAVQGTAGRLDVELAAQGITLSTSEGSRHLDTLFMPQVRDELRSIFVDEVRHFAACVRQSIAPAVTARDAVIAVRIAEAAVESARTHRPVNLSPAEQP